MKDNARNSPILKIVRETKSSLLYNDHVSQVIQFYSLEF